MLAGSVGTAFLLGWEETRSEAVPGHREPTAVGSVARQQGLASRRDVWGGAGVAIMDGTVQDEPAPCFRARAGLWAGACSSALAVVRDKGCAGTVFRG